MKRIVAESFDPRFDARFQPGYQQEPETRAPESPAPVGAVPEPNPFERTLWVIAAVLIIGGVAAAFWANGLNYSQSAIDGGWTWPRIIQNSGWALSGPMVTIGLATGVGLLFRRAITWSPPE